MPNYRTLCRRCRRWAVIGRPYVDWYADARRILGRISWHRRWDYGTWVDTVAICSPRTSVRRNLKLAYRAMDGMLLDDATRSTRVALEHYRTTGEIRGPKTSRFAKVLRGADNVVVVDSWMARALSVPIMQARNRTSQVLAEQVIGHVARAERLSLSDAQAVVWCGYIRTYYKKGTVPNYRTEDVGLYSDVDGVIGLSDTPF